jgi:hypothetical protein
MMPRMVVQGVPIGWFGQHLHVVRTYCWTRDWLLFANALRFSCGYSSAIELFQTPKLQIIQRLSPTPEDFQDLSLF